jgi:hypothetical protein
MGHPQPKTPIQTDNSMAEGVVNNRINPKEQKQWICVFIGYKILRLRINSEFTGGQGKPTLQITLQKTIHQHII